MTIKRVQKKIDWTPEDRARHQAIRKTFKDRPALEQLIARGELTGTPVTLGAYLNLLEALDKVIEWRVADASSGPRKVRPRVKRR